MRSRVVAAAFALCCLASGCRRERSYAVEKVDVGATGALPRAGLKVSRADLEAALARSLRAEGFQLHDAASGKEPPAGALRLALEVPLAQPDPAKVGAVLQIRRRTEAGPARYEVEAIGQAPPAERGEAGLRTALELAIDRAVRKARIQVVAADKDDEALVKDLTAGDPVVRESAVRVLTDRRNPAVAQALLEQLQADDASEVRRAIGALVEMKERRAVEPLIELANGRDPVFLREVIYALGGLGGDEAQAFLYTVAQGHDQPSIRDAAQQALDELTRSEQKPDRGLSSRESGEGEGARH